MSSSNTDPAVPLHSPVVQHHDEEEEDEEWSEDDDEDAPRKRKRARFSTTAATSRPMSVSCELCKQRKVKCDRGQPSCGWCVRNGQVCEYRERKKPGLRAGYGRELEGRLDKLEGIMQAQQTLLQQLAEFLPNRRQAAIFDSEDTGSSQNHGATSESALYSSMPKSFGARSTPKARQDDGVHWQLASGDPNPHVDYFTADMSALNMPSSASPVATVRDGHAISNQALGSPNLKPNGGDPPPLLGAHSNGSIQAVSQDQDFPPYDLLYGLTDLYFRHVNTWCPILHRRTTLDLLFGPSTLEEADRILLHAIVATTLRYSSDSRLTDHTREQYHSISKQKVLLYGLENSSVKALQALVILALDIVGNSNGPPGWNLLALITRSVVQLGLAIETTSSTVAPLYPSIYTLRAMVLPEPTSFIEDESRRRLFWMVYLLDRYATIATAFEFALDEKEIDRKLPCRDDLFARNQFVETRWFRPDAFSDCSANSPDNLGSFSYYVEIVGILSQVHRFLKRPVDIGTLPDVETWQREYRQLDSTLTNWKFGLPNEYGHMGRLFVPSSGNKVVNCIWVMLHATYHTTVIRLHSSAAYPTTRSPIFTPSYAASRRCLTAVEEICTLCSYVRSNGMLNQLGPPFAFSLWVAARLLLVHGSTIDNHVSGAIGPLIETLRELGAAWKVAARYATLLQRVMDEYADSVAAEVPRAQPPSAVRILADMRRTAFDLDFLISRQPRQSFGAAQTLAGGTSKPDSSVATAAISAQASSSSLAVPFTSLPANCTPARTPAPSDLDAYDMFDFFNVPRLGGSVDVFVQQAPPQQQQASLEGGIGLAGSNEFNITNFIYDTNADWLGDMGT